MAKKGNVRRISDKKKNRPKIRFNFWLMIIIFALSFAGCFVLYMVAANIDDDFFDDQFKTVVEESVTDATVSSPDLMQDPSEGTSADQQTTDVSPVIQNPIPASAAVDVSYLENCCLVTDATLMGISDSGFSDVFTSAELNASSVGTAKVSSSYGTVTVYETLKIKKPMNVYIMLGSDIGISDMDSMISAYTSLVSNLKLSLPEMKIYIMQLPPAYADAGKNALINEYNTKLLALAENAGVYCIDTNTELKNNEGNLSDEYFDAESVKYTDKYYKDICGYILTHTV